MADPGKLRLDDQLCFALYAATNAVTRAYRPLLARIGLTYPQYIAMMVLWQDGSCPIGQIAERLQLPPHAVSPLIDRLEAAGLVRREHDRCDRRIVRVALTPNGAALEQAAFVAQQAVECATELDPDVLAAVRGELTALAGRMQRSPAGRRLAAETAGKRTGGPRSRAAG